MNKAWRHMTPVALTGTAAGPMTEAERARYLAGAPLPCELLYPECRQTCMWPECNGQPVGDE